MENFERKNGKMRPREKRRGEKLEDKRGEKKRGKNGKFMKLTHLEGSSSCTVHSTVKYLQESVFSLACPSCDLAARY